MTVDFLIVGQGISGTWLSYYLQKAGFSFVVIDEINDTAASRVAAGMINPVTGRRIVKTWMIDELLPFVNSSYRQLGNELGITAIEQKNVIDFFPTVQMKMAFEKALPENPEYLLSAEDENQWLSIFNYELGYGEISPAYLVNLQQLLPAWRSKLTKENLLLNEKFLIDDLQVKEESIVYGNIIASKIIFCDGVESFNNPWFKNLPFAPNKGEVLWIEADDLPATNIFKKGIALSPWKENIFWAGPSYEWDFKDDLPTTLFREKTEGLLRHWLKAPFKVVDHKASLRPANLERRPFVGWHPVQPQIGVFNGMGTKGCSLAPYFADQFVRHIKFQTPLLPEADVKRFSKILSR